jgi:nucleoside-diphosphate-sugar epimerase
LNLGTGQGTTIKEVVEIAGDILGIEPNINYLPQRPGEIDNFVADTSKLRRIFSAVPDTPLDKGLRQTFSWLSSL